MEGTKIVPAENGFPYLEMFSTKLYGERGRFFHNLKRYIESSEFQSACRKVRNVEDIPLISEDQIRGQIEREAFFREMALSIQDSVWGQGGHVSDSDYIKLSIDMGIAPGLLHWEDRLFPHLMDFDIASKEEREALMDKIITNQKTLSFAANFMMDYLSNRQIVTYAGRRVLSQGYARNYFRGENAYYASSRPSLFRTCPSENEKGEIELHKLVGVIRIIEFTTWIKQLKATEKWFVDIFYSALAQHYGIPTNGLDITSNLKVALFFACCCIDKETGAWRPLRKDEFEYANSRRYIAELGGDSRYAVLSVAPADICEMSRVSKDSEMKFTSPIPVGYQPYMRCAYQSSYLIDADQTYDLYQDITFAKYKFRLTESICQWIYYEMHSGRDIYPEEGLTRCEDIIRRIKKMEVYSKSSLKVALAYLKSPLSFEDAVDLLKRHDHICRPCVQWCSEKRIAEINRQWTPPDFTSNNDVTRFRFCV